MKRRKKKFQELQQSQTKTSSPKVCCRYGKSDSAGANLEQDGTCSHL